MQTLQQKAFVSGTSVQAKARVAVSSARCPLVVRAQKEEAVDRRAALGLFAAAAALASTKPAEAAYGDQARVFAGKITNKTGFVPYAGDGFALLIPSKWNPSKEKDFPGTVFRYEDNFDAVNNAIVLQQKVGKSSITDLGSPDKWLSDNAYLFGQTAAFNDPNSRSEGGFAAGKVASAAVLDVQEVTDKNGKTYYKYEVLTRTADGDEGGRHHLVAATVSNGDLYVLKIQVGDKRWFKGVNKEALGTFNSFTVA